MRRLVALFLLCATLAHAQGYPRLACYSTNRTFGPPLMVNGVVDTALVTRLARHHVITLDIAPWFSVHGPQRTEVPLLIRRANPKCVILAYHLAAHWYLPPSFVPQASDRSFPASWHRAIQATNGWLWTTGGVVKLYYEVDWSRAEVADTLTSLLCAVAASRLYDGVFLDFWSWSISWASQGSNPPADFRRSGWTSLAQMDSARWSNMHRAVRRIKAAGGPNFRFVMNGTGEQRWTDGSMREGFPFPLTSFRAAQDWLRESDGTMDWLQAGVYRQGDYHAARYALGVGCVLGVAVSAGPDRNLNVSPPYQGWWWDESSVDRFGASDTTARFMGWLGEPRGPAAQVAPGIWRRDFVDGIVLVNPGGVPATLDLGRPYRRILGIRDPLTNDGRTEQVVTVSANDALFLVRP